jgi:hypothetical protein
MSEKTRIEEFTLDGKNFIYIDLCDLKSNEEFDDLLEVIAPTIEKHPPASLYTITNIESIKFDTKTKEIIVKFLEHNKAYVKYGAIIGFDGTKKFICNVLLAQSGRDNLFFAFTREQAVEFLLKKE